MVALVSRMRIYSLLFVSSSVRALRRARSDRLQMIGMFRNRGGRPPWRLILAASILLALGGQARATPPEYASFGRTQKVSVDIKPDELLRVWMVYVEQGDGLLIQLPERFNYDPDPTDDNPRKSERIDVMIDGGATPNSERKRMARFIAALYPDSTPIIEYAVITHHDSDHVEGLIHLLQDTDVPVRIIYHNGLASYRGGVRGFPTKGAPSRPAVYKSQAGPYMGFLQKADGNSDYKRFEAQYLINNLPDLRRELDAGHLQGVYEKLAKAVKREQTEMGLKSFARVYNGSKFINDQDAGQGNDISAVQFTPIWPLKDPRKYGPWSETINGNSVTFRLKYGAFEMLFTGDHNEKSEAHLLEEFGPNHLDVLNCDVLKVPHHGAGGTHALEDFYTNEHLKPVLSVASMGRDGFESKALPGGSSNWQHPATEVIEWLGGFHRFYSTLIHERAFRWEDLKTKADHERLIERSHILIETDGKWFRLVEVDASRDVDRIVIPTVVDTQRSNGTRWIKAD